MRGATSSGHPSPYPCRCFNPRAPCGARHSVEVDVTHSTGFNPRAPCGARRPSLMDGASFLMFQSTRPMRGATDSKGGQQLSDAVSIHAPHAGRDRASSRRALLQGGFQSTRPMRGATLCGELLLCLLGVSIHAPHAGRDSGYIGFPSRSRSFNPRAPCGARLSGLLRCPDCGRFQSTRPMRGATTVVTPIVKDKDGFNPRAPCGARRRSIR